MGSTLGYVVTLRMNIDRINWTEQCWMYLCCVVGPLFSQTAAVANTADTLTTADTSLLGYVTRALSTLYKLLDKASLTFFLDNKQTQLREDRLKDIYNLCFVRKT